MHTESHVTVITIYTVEQSTVTLVVNPSLQADEPSLPPYDTLRCRSTHNHKLTSS